MFDKKKLKRIMRERKLTPSYMTFKLHQQSQQITDVSIRNWISGRNKPDIDNIKMLADFFNVSIDYFFTQKEGRSTLPLHQP